MHVSPSLEMERLQGGPFVLDEWRNFDICMIAFLRYTGMAAAGPKEAAIACGRALPPSRRTALRLPIVFDSPTGSGEHAAMRGTGR
jgi:hypothetical protein